MAFSYEFPHSSNIDSDLRQILEMYFTVKDLPEEWKNIKTLIPKEISDKIQELEDSGYFEEIINTTIFGELNSRVSNNTRAIEHQSDSISSLESSDTQQNQRISALESSDTQQNQRISALESGAASSTRRYILVSDSYGKTRESVNNPWINIVTSMLAPSDVYSTAVGSMGFEQEGDSHLRVINAITELYRTIPSPNTITDVVIALGANDININDHSILTSRIHAVIDYILSVSPKANIKIGFIGNIKQKNGATLTNYLNAVNKYIRASVYKTSCYMTNIECIMHNWQFFVGDGIHPTQDGSNEIALAVYNYLHGIPYDFVAHTSITAANGTITQTIHNNIFTMSTSRLDFGSTTMSSGLTSQIMLSNLSGLLSGGIGGHLLLANCLTFLGNVEAPQSYPSYIYIYDNKLYLTVSNQGDRSVEVIQIGNSQVSLSTLLV